MGRSTAAALRLRSAPWPSSRASVRPANQNVTRVERQVRHRATAPPPTRRCSTSWRRQSSSSPSTIHGWRPPSRSSHPPAWATNGSAAAPIASRRYRARAPSRPRQSNQHPSANTPISAVPAPDHRAEAPVHEPDDRDVVARPVLSLRLGLELVDPPHGRTRREVVQQRKRRRQFDVHQQVPRVGREPGQREQRQPGGTLGLVQRLGRGHLHRLLAQRQHALEVPEGRGAAPRTRARSAAPCARRERTARRHARAADATRRPRAPAPTRSSSEPNSTCAVVNATFQLKSTGQTSTSRARPSTSS